MGISLVLIMALETVLVSYANSEPKSIYTERYGDRDQYFCHCKGDEACNKDTGECPDSECSEDWFGPACQFVALEYLATGPLIRKQGRCPNIDGITEIIAKDIQQSLSWIRLVFQSNGSTAKRQIGVSYQFDQSANITNFQQNCKETAWTPSSNGKVLDIYCPSEHTVDRVILTGLEVDQVCDLYTSGGQNIALGLETVEQSSTIGNHVPYHAVDGYLATTDTVDGCIHAQRRSSDTETWWKISFSKPQNIVVFKIIGPGGHRAITLREFELTAYRIDNSIAYTYANPNKTSYIYTLKPSNEVKNVKSVTITNRNEDLYICELYIFGARCPFGYYGHDCSQLCGHCLHDQCDPISGNCYMGCGTQTSYSGSKCKDCPAGSYGADCSKKCAEKCPKTCDNVDGTCKVCPPGYTGTSCKDACPEGTFGLECKDKCPQNCRGGCDPVDGTCKDGCLPGYKGLKCNQRETLRPACPHGDCSQLCALCRDEQCVLGKGVETPTCTRGCKDGYSGSDCRQVCQNRTFGLNCSQQCGFCAISSCSPHNGTCPFGCLSGYEQPYCNRESVLSNTAFNRGIQMVFLLATLPIFVIAGLCLGACTRRKRRRPKSLRRKENLKLKPAAKTAKEKVDIEAAAASDDQGEEEDSSDESSEGELESSED